VLIETVEKAHAESIQDNNPHGAFEVEANEGQTADGELKLFRNTIKLPPTRSSQMDEPQLSDTGSSNIKFDYT
jgi:hypothetical protein